MVARHELPKMPRLARQAWWKMVEKDKLLLRVLKVEGTLTLSQREWTNARKRGRRKGKTKHQQQKQPQKLRMQCPCFTRSVNPKKDRPSGDSVAKLWMILASRVMRGLASTRGTGRRKVCRQRPPPRAPRPRWEPPSPVFGWVKTKPSSAMRRLERGREEPVRNNADKGRSWVNHGINNSGAGWY